MRQPPLITTGSSLLSPMFTPRPGWGGKLRTWFGRNFYIVLFRGLLLVAITIIGSSLIHSWQVAQIVQPLTLSPTPTPSVVYEFVAAHGVGMSQLAARVLDAYLTERSIHLDSAQHLFAVDALTRQAGWRHLAPGERVAFNVDTLAQIALSAKALTPLQHAAWLRLVRERFD